LPTEAEWEYGCRGGRPSSLAFGIGNGRALSPSEANVERDSTCRVGSYPANALGLCDMHGNVWEWCADWFREPYPPPGDAINPIGPEKGTDRVIRGGAYRSYPGQHRAAYRGMMSNRYQNLGFRLARSLPPGGK
jgi:formylglycine-generating enzyme required for sulfatase activity